MPVFNLQSLRSWMKCGLRKYVIHKPVYGPESKKYISFSQIPGLSSWNQYITWFCFYILFPAPFQTQKWSRYSCQIVTETQHTARILREEEAREGSLDKHIKERQSEERVQLVQGLIICRSLRENTISGLVGWIFLKSEIYLSSIPVSTNSSCCWKLE